MATFQSYQLYFNGPVHLSDERGDYGSSLRVLHSDTIYSALIACLAEVGYPIPDDGDLKFTLTSLFPFFQKSKNDDPILFFPIPLGYEMPYAKFPDHRKQLKKVAWVDLINYQRILNGEQVIRELRDVSKIQGEYLSDQDIDPDFIHDQVSRRVLVPRNNQDPAEPFWMDRLFFKGSCGLHFLAVGEGTEILEKALNVLKHQGIGTDRNVGNGVFEYEKNTIELDLPKSDHMTNLSLFCPASPEELYRMMNTSDASYQLIRRGGWITTTPFNTLRKNSIHAFSVGSVFGFETVAEPLIQGKIVNLRPETGFKDNLHPIWRDFKSLFIPINLTH